MREKWEGKSLSWNDMLRTAKDKGNAPWSMEMVKVSWLDWGCWCILICNPGLHLHALVDVGYSKLLMMRWGAPSDFPVMS